MSGDSSLWWPRRRVSPALSCGFSPDASVAWTSSTNQIAGPSGLRSRVRTERSLSFPYGEASISSFASVDRTLPVGVPAGCSLTLAETWRSLLEAIYAVVEVWDHTATIYRGTA